MTVFCNTPLHMKQHFQIAALLRTTADLAYNSEIGSRLAIGRSVYGTANSVFRVPD